MSPPSTWGAFTSSDEIAGDRDEVEIVFHPATWAPKISEHRGKNWNHGDATVLVSDLLGHRPDDLRLI